MNYPLPKDGSIDYMLSIAKARAKRCVEKKIVIEQDEDDYPLYQVVTKEMAKTELGEIFDEVAMKTQELNCTAKALESICINLGESLGLTEADLMQMYLTNMGRQKKISDEESIYLNEGESLAAKKGFTLVK